MMNRSSGLLILVAMAMFGCVSAEKAGGPKPIEKLRGTLNELWSSGQTNEIPVVLEAALVDGDLSNDRVEIFRLILGVRVNRGDVAGAQQRFLAATNDISLATGGLGIIERHMMQKRDFEGVSRWCLSLLDAPFPEPVRESLAGTLIESYRERLAFGDIESFVPRILGEFSAAAARRLLSGTLDRLLTQKQFQPAEKLLGLLSEAAAAPAEVKELVTVYGIKIPLARQDMGSARKAFMAAVFTLPDDVSAGLMGQMLKHYREAADLPTADNFCMDVVHEEKVGPQLRLKAMRESVLLAREMHKPEATVIRLLKTLKLEMPSGQKLALIRTVIYDTMEKGDKTVRQTMMHLCESIRGQCESKPERAEADNLLLDSCFLSEDFDLALKIVEGGIEGLEPEWKDNLVVKVKAHAAMKAGQHAEAAELFQAFMERVKVAEASKVEAQDPSTGLRVTKDEVLGLNAARVAGLWRAAGQKDKADASLKEARSYYETALAQFKEETGEYQALKKKLQELN